MKRNVNVFLAVVLVAMLCGGIIWLRTAKDEKLGWNIHDTYGEAPAYANSGAAYTNASFAGPSNDSDVMRMSPSRSMRHSAVSLRAGAYAISYGVTPASSPIAYSQSPIANSLTASSPSGAGLYTTSSKTFNSYGGGGNGGTAMGGAMRGSSSPNSLIASSPITSISPIAYSTARRSDMTVAMGENLAMMAAENPVMAMTNAASAGMSNGFYGGYTVMDYSGSANYGQYSSMFGGGSRMGVRGRQNSGLKDSWLDWLYRYGFSFGTESGDPENGYYYTFTEEQLRNAYNEYITNYWDPMWHPGESKPTFEQWLEWMELGGESGYYYNKNWYMMAPVGDILPLLLLALLYIVAMYLRSKSRTQVND